MHINPRPRYNRTLFDKCRCVFLDAKIPFDEWPLVVEAVAWIINRTPCRSNPQWKTPYEMFYGTKPDVSHIRTLGSLVHVHLDKSKRVEKKFGARALVRILIGYSSNGIKAINPINFSTLTTCNYRATEHLGWEDAKASLLDHPDENFVSDPMLDHSYSWMYAASGNPSSLSDSLPKTFKEALRSPFAGLWAQAIQSEFESLFSNNVWSNIYAQDQALIKGKRLVSTKWIFSVKYDGEQEIAKARLVARGFQDRNEYDLCETFSPVINQTVIRWVISFANHFRLRLIAMDVKTAFLYGEITQDVFLSVPEGLDVSSDVIALKLNRAMYGLKTASKIWFQRFSSELARLGFKNFFPDQCVFYLHRDGEIVVIAVYVDDCFIAYSNASMGEKIVSQLAHVFKLKVMQQPKIFVGLEISRFRESYTICQKTYILKLGAKFGVFPPQYVTTPMEARLVVKKDPANQEYPNLRALIGGLLFVGRCSRPDILYAVNKLSRFQTCANKLLFDYALRVLKYLVSTPDYALIYNSFDDEPVVAYVDASFADAKDDQYQSTGGYLIFAHGDLVAWNAKKLPLTDTSTAGSEYSTLNYALREIMFVRSFYSLILGVDKPAVIFEDNTSALNIANGTETSFSRFLLTKYYAIRQAVMDGEVVIRKIATADQLADIMTKALDKSKFTVIRDFLLKSLSEFKE